MGGQDGKLVLAALLLGMTVLSGSPPPLRADPAADPAAVSRSLSPAAVAGTWRSHRPAGGGDREFVFTLRLLADGTAELLTAESDGLPFLEKGSWSLRGTEITVLVFEEGRPPDPNEMLLEVRGDTLVPVRWNPEFYGKSPLGAFLRQPEGEPVRSP